MQKVSFYIASNNDIDFNSVKIIRTHEPCVPTRGKAFDFNYLASEKQPPPNLPEGRGKLMKRQSLPASPRGGEWMKG